MSTRYSFVSYCYSSNIRGTHDSVPQSRYWGRDPLSHGDRRSWAYIAQKFDPCFICKKVTFVVNEMSYYTRMCAHQQHRG